MAAKLSVLFAFVGLTSTGVAPSEFMLCLHSDGKALVEHYQELCCKAPCPDSSDDRGDDAPSDCPDDQCRDYPLTIAAQGVLDASPTQNPEVNVSDISFIESPRPNGILEVLDPRPEAGDLDPPDSTLLAFLRTVILRH